MEGLRSNGGRSDHERVADAARMRGVVCEDAASGIGGLRRSSRHPPIPRSYTGKRRSRHKVADRQRFFQLRVLPNRDALNQDHRACDAYLDTQRPGAEAIPENRVHLCPTEGTCRVQSVAGRKSSHGPTEQLVCSGLCGEREGEEEKQGEEFHRTNSRRSMFSRTMPVRDRHDRDGDLRDAGFHATFLSAISARNSFSTAASATRWKRAILRTLRPTTNMAMKERRENL